MKAPIVFRAGDVIQGYRLLEDFRVVGAGLSEWTFAERAGREYFIKRFLSPTYPPPTPTTTHREAPGPRPASGLDALPSKRTTEASWPPWGR